MKKREKAGLKYLKDPTAFIEYSKTMDDIYDDIEDYNKKRKRKVFIVLSVRLNCTHYIISKLNNKRGLQNIAINHSADIDYKDLVNIYRNCTKEPYNFLTIDTTQPVDKRFRKSFNDPLQKNDY